MFPYCSHNPKGDQQKLGRPLKEVAEQVLENSFDSNREHATRFYVLGNLQKPEGDLTTGTELSAYDFNGNEIE